MKRDGCMINLENGTIIDIVTNKPVIDNMTKLRLENTLDK